MTLGLTVEELLVKLSSRELTDWMAFYEIEPWGSLIDSKRQSTTAATMANVGLMISNPKRLRTHPFTSDQFEIKLKSALLPSKPKQTWEEQKRIIERVAKKIDGIKRRRFNS